MTLLDLFNAYHKAVEHEKLIRHYIIWDSIGGKHYSSHLPDAEKKVRNARFQMQYALGVEFDEKTLDYNEMVRLIPKELKALREEYLNSQRTV